MKNMMWNGKVELYYGEEKSYNRRFSKRDGGSR